MQWSQVYAISDLVMHHVQKNDPEFYRHLQNICKLNADFKAKDFVIDLMLKVNTYCSGCIVDCSLSAYEYILTL